MVSGVSTPVYVRKPKEAHTQGRVAAQSRVGQRPVASSKDPAHIKPTNEKNNPIYDKSRSTHSHFDQFRLVELVVGRLAAQAAGLKTRTESKVSAARPLTTGCIAFGGVIEREGKHTQIQRVTMR